MKGAIIGSRKLTAMSIAEHIPTGCSEIITGGARGIDSLAEEYSRTAGIRLCIIPPDYRRFGRGAPLIRNRIIVDLADIVIAFWDGSSRGTKSVIDYCKSIGKPLRIIECTH